MDTAPPQPHRVESGFILVDMSTPIATGSQPLPHAGEHDHATLGNTFIDPQDKFWSMYLSDAEKYDKFRIESWKGDTEGILIFVRALRFLFQSHYSLLDRLRLVCSLPL